MTTTAIFEACTARLRDYAVPGNYPTTWPGLQFKPPDRGIWLEARFFPNEPEDLALDPTSCHASIGFFQVTVCFRPGTSQTLASTVADEIIAHYPKGFELGPVRVKKRPWQSPLITDKDKLYIPVTIPYLGGT